MAMFSIELFVTNVWMTFVLAVLFVVNMAIGCYNMMSKCLCSIYNYGSIWCCHQSIPQANYSDGITSSASVKNPISHSNRPTNRTDSDLSIGNMHETGMELSKIA